MTVKKYFGDKRFYRSLLMLMIPIAVQQGITNFVSLLDNIMIGELGEISISAVSVINQLLFIMNLSIFGMLSGSSIFGAQFYGKRDEEGLRMTFRFKVISTLALTAVFVALFLLFPDTFIKPFLDNENNTPEQIAEALSLAKDYLRIMIIGLFPFAVVQIYGNTLKDCSETVSPMVGSCIAIVVNLTFNYILIFGKLGFPVLGVRGAAIATVIARFSEMLFIVIRTHTRLDKFTFMRGVYRTMRVPLHFVKSVFITGIPLAFNEVMWSVGTTLINLNYSTRGIDDLAAININNTFWQVFCVVMFAMGAAISVILGQMLGAGRLEEAKADSIRLITFNCLFHVGVGLIIIALSGVLPLIYNVSDYVRSTTTSLLIVAGIFLPVSSLIHATYFTIRSGGRTFITFLFDSVYTWAVPLLLSFILSKYTSLPIVPIYAAVQFSDVIKLCIAIPMLKSGFWARNITSDK